MFAHHTHRLSRFHALKHSALLRLTASERAGRALTDRRAEAVTAAARQHAVNQWAAMLRTQGYAVPAGSTLFGTAVTE